MAKTASVQSGKTTPPHLASIVRILEKTTAHSGIESACRSLTQAILREFPQLCAASLWSLGSSGSKLLPMAVTVRKIERVESLDLKKLNVTMRAAGLSKLCSDGKPYLCNDSARKPALIRLQGLPHGSELCIPVKEAHGTHTLLDICSPQAGAITKEHLETFQILAQHVAKSLHNSIIQEHLRTMNERLMELQLLGSEINASLELREILDATIRRLPGIMNLRLCSVFLYNPVTNSLELRAHNHQDLSEKKISIKHTENRIMNQIIGLSRSRWIRDIETEFHRRNRRKYTSKSSLNLILKAGEKLIGVLNLNDKLDGSNFTEEDFNLTDLFANQLALSINNSHLYSRTLQMALFDGLTGLYVHRHFQETLERETARSKRTGATFSLILADIDHFKDINDRFGHQSGDIVLRALAGIFMRLVRQIDYVCRYGGEEFAFLLPDTALGRAKVLAARIRHAVYQTRFRLSGKSCRLSLSMGIAENDGTLEKEEVLRRADQALYAAKREGRNRIILFDDSVP
jgi:diguanylate cyclase (GGDEF)-like protein